MAITRAPASHLQAFVLLEGLVGDDAGRGGMDRLLRSAQERGAGGDGGGPPWDLVACRDPTLRALAAAARGGGGSGRGLRGGLAFRRVEGGPPAGLGRDLHGGGMGR